MAAFGVKMAKQTYQPVAEGGFWSLSRPQISSNTQQLLKTMMQESHLTNFQQRQLDKAAKNGSSLPSTCHPTSSAKPRGPPKQKVVSKVLNPRNYSSHTRTKEQIEATGAYDRDQFQPMPQTKFNGVYEKDKRRLANLMAFGQDVEPVSKPVRPVRREEDDELVEVDRFQELEDEIAERRNFLREMEQLGKGNEYRTVIETEISQMIREMEIIDARKTSELQRIIAMENGGRQQAAASAKTGHKTLSTRQNGRTS